MKDCVFYVNTEVCICLNKKKCSGCKFFKNKKEYKRVYENRKYVGVIKKWQE